MSAALRLHELAFNAITEMVSVLGEDEVYRMVNAAWCRVVGCTPEQIIGHTVRAVFPDGVDPERRYAVRDCLRSSQPVTVRGPLGVPRLAGRLFEATYSPYGVDESGVRCVVVVTRDITDAESRRAALATSDAYLRRTLNATGDAIFASDAADPDVPVRFVNQQMLTMWGMPEALAEGLTPRQILAHSAPLFLDAEYELQRIRHIVANKLTQDDVITLRDGRTLRRRCVASTDQVHGDTVRVWSFRDITLETEALRRIQQAEAQTRELLDAFPGSIAVLDERLRYTYVNPRALAMLGLSRDQVLGKSVVELRGPQRADEVAALCQRALRGEVVAYEVEFADATLQVTLCGGLSARTGRPQFYGFGEDISTRKQAELALVAARDDAERANRAKSQFLSHMSHELRTPLHAIMGFAQVVTVDDAAPLAPAQRRAIDEIARGGRHLLQLVNDVLDLQGVEAGSLEVELVPLALAPLVQECVNLMQPLAATRGVTLSALTVAPGAALHAMADATRLRQVLLNLLGNAIKYNHQGGSVALHSRAQAGRVRITVADTGVGLSADEQARLFTPFDRLHAAAGTVEGAGIGLALSRQLMQAMGGEIGVSSQPGQGSQFWIELPQPAPAAIAAAKKAPTALAPASFPPGPWHVLYIEDNEVNIVLMEAMLSRVPGLTLVSEMQPEAGLARAKRQLPDLILLDIQLPVMSGFQVLQHLRASASTRDIPVIAVSANAMPGDIEGGLAAGFADYITKPVNLATLLDAVRRALAGLPRPAA